MPLDPTTPEGMAFDLARARDADRLLNSLKAALKMFPSMRVGQLIDNCLSPRTKERGIDLFTISNKELAELIEFYMKGS